LKPEDPEELERLSQSGARVLQFSDQDGNPVGPFRVWHPEEDGPGLAMSRSIGDHGSKNLGIIATPVITKYDRNLNSDMFVVAGSDGLWDVMENEEVVDFVEHYRRY
jgi:integrin-linked kinase-associated serine/threonine phosphatase 2C